MTTAPVTKICPKCKRALTLDNFNKDKKTKDQLFYICRLCQHEDNMKREPIRVWAQNTLKGHKRRGFEIHISLDELCETAIKTTHCIICAVKLDYSIGKRNNGVLIKDIKGGGQKPNSPSLDRRDNGNEMNVENTRIICSQCNRGKGEMTDKEYIEHCGKVWKNKELLLKK